MIRRTVALTCALVSLGLTSVRPATAATRPEHVVVVTLVGVGWDDIAAAHIPVLRHLMDTGSIAAVSIRTADIDSTPVRGYLTLGAGNRAFAMVDTAPLRDQQDGRLGFASSAPFENGTAGEAMARRVAHPRTGEVVHVSVPLFDAAGDRYHYGTRVGALGEALASHHIPRAVVAAADLSPTPDIASLRRAAVLSIADASGTVDHGTVDGLVQSEVQAPFGVRTDPALVEAAVKRALSAARVTFVEPGETFRTDELAIDMPVDRIPAARREALERTDVLLGGIAKVLGPRDVLYVVGVSSPLAAKTHNHLTPLIGHGAGIGRGWLTSPTTHRSGIVALTDVAPTVLQSLGIAVPSSMNGTMIRSVPSGGADRIAYLSALDRQSVFRDHFAEVVTVLVIVLLGLLAIALLLGLVDRPRLGSVVVAPAFALVSVPIATMIVRLLPADRVGLVGGSVLLGALIASITALCIVVRAAKWKVATVLLLVTFVATAVDLLAGAPLQLNGALGYAPIDAGRFYGQSNLEFAVLIASGMLGVLGLADALGRDRTSMWAAGVLVGMVLIDGLPQFGADLGGVLATVPALLVIYAFARRRRVRLTRILLWGVAAAVAAVGVTVIDLARPPQSRTHLGRFASNVLSGGLPALGTVLVRKASSSLSSFGYNWAWTIPIAALAVFLIVRGRPDALRRLLRDHPLVAAACAGAMVAGVLGMLLNDSGTPILGMFLALVVPVLALISLDGAAGARSP